ncbi:BZ3500_MvSof-1268-A1-R1_Chr5-2g07843 [Microbotryum saponariae]|uniref:BZ3500_MvSof-1268-A1-R1_Chr5-2g07843 protein n=1 Tax=Microbotryum saponariae TaxID=289078 RepID=A0A2X0NDT5_9BASI|nr:BZ3500_MvSof-1268-A1-R1_Chr5-2g07843 [Microbotryum saponariae]SDA05712.1 BZ3501_MvSof-1269-A2-R1_Chr5-2g07665 [Microbotryum saponariae]
MTRWMYAVLCALVLPLSLAQGGPSRTVSEDSEQAFEVHQRRAAMTQLSRGQYMQSGNINTNLRWQSSGELNARSCPSLGGTMTIRNCYQLFLERRGMLQSTSQSSSTSNRLLRRASLEDQAAADDTKLDLYYRVFPEQAKYRWMASSMVMVGGLYRRQAPACPVDNTTTTTPGGPTQTPTVSPRQRIEFLTWPGTTPNQVWSYTWKSYQSADTKGTNNFFHAWQKILRRDGCGGPVITQDYVGDKVQINDIVRGCKGCTSMPLKNWVGKTIIHTMTVKYGLSGSITYQAVDTNNRKVPLLKYAVAKGDMGSSASFKFGMYRAVNSQLRAATSWYGEFAATKISG